MEWIIENKSWLFSGIAISIPLTIAGWIIAKKNKSQSQSQSQKSGDFSNNIQVGRDLNIDKK